MLAELTEIAWQITKLTWTLVLVTIGAVLLGGIIESLLESRQSRKKYRKKDIVKRVLNDFNYNKDRGRESKEGGDD